HAVTLCHGWVVKYRYDEVMDVIARTDLLHDGLADAANVGCFGAKGVNAEDLKRPGVEEQLQHSDVLPTALGTGNILEVRPPNLIRNPGCGKLALRFSKRADFRQCENAGGGVGHNTARIADNCSGHRAHLVVRCTGQ